MLAGGVALRHALGGTVLSALAQHLFKGQILEAAASRALQGRPNLRKPAFVLSCFVLQLVQVQALPQYLRTFMRISEINIA